MSIYHAQVGREHYSGEAYRYQDRWNSYWHQLNLVRSVNPQDVVEIGVGGGVVARELRESGIRVVTVDIAADLKPDVVGSVTNIPLPDKSADVALAAEILEHIEFVDVPVALRELKRVARTHVVISIPRPGYIFSFIGKFPLLPRMAVLFKIPFFWKTHIFNGEHYWELSKKNYSVATFVHMASSAGLTLVRSYEYADDPGHRFFVFSV